MVKRNVRRKNKKIKFSEEDYIEKNYMKDGKGIIPVELNSIDELYMQHDYLKMELSDSFCDYVEEIAYMIPINTDLVIEIHSPKIDEETQEKIKKSIKNNYGIEIDDTEYDMKLLDQRSIVLITIGIFLLIFNFFFGSYLNSFLSEFLSIIWWVGIWNAVELQFFDKSDGKWRRLNYQQLYDSEIVFIFDK